MEHQQHGEPTNHGTLLINVINAKKTGFLIASLDTRMVHSGQITLIGETIAATRELKVLGVKLDATMQFTGHIKGKTVAARRMLGHIGSVPRRWHMPGVMAHIYNACIRPAMCYATVLTYGVSRGGDDMYDRVDRLADRLTGGTVTPRRAPHSSSSSRLAAEARRRRLQLAHQYAHSLRHAPPDIHIASPTTTTIRTRSQDTAPKLVTPPVSSVRVAVRHTQDDTRIQSHATLCPQQHRSRSKWSDVTIRGRRGDGEYPRPPSIFTTTTTIIITTPIRSLF